MKRFLTRAAAKIARFFWSWGFLKFVLWTITLIVLFYVEEDWRGARAWAATKAKWQAKGETFDPAKFIPPPVPDGQNLAAIPLFRLDPPSKDAGYLVPLVLQKAMRQDLPSGDLPSLGDWQRTQAIDIKAVEGAISADYMAAFHTKPPADPLLQFNALFPFLSDLLAASATRSFCRLPGEYSFSPPVSRPLIVLTEQLRLSRILNLHAIIALHNHRSDLALDDVEANYKILTGAAHDPSLIGGLIAIAMTSVDDASIYYGLSEHAWTNVQLAELMRTLEPINFLSVFQFDVRSEAVTSIGDIDYFEKSPRRLYSTSDGHFTRETLLPLPEILLRPPWPTGWWDQNKSQLADFLLNDLSTVDPEARRVFPELNENLEHQNEKAENRPLARAPWNIWFALASAPLKDIAVKYSFAQVRLDEARIACALERYRLAHGAYPLLLNALIPDCIDTLPRDIMNGEPYRYRSNPEGSYLLYSVGWNEIDEGGLVTIKSGSQIEDYEQGDWVWPAPK